MVDPVALHQLERGGRVEARHDDVVAAQEEAPHRRAEGAVVVERPGHQVRPAGEHAVDLGGQLGDVDDRGEAGDDQLRAPRAAARGGRLPLGGHPVGEVACSESGGRLEADRDPGAAGDVGADDKGGVGEVDDLLQLQPRRAAGDRLRRRAQLPGGQAGLEELDPIGQSDRHHRPFPNTELLVGTGQLIGPRVDFGARDRDALVGDRRGIGSRRHQVAKYLGERGEF